MRNIVMTFILIVGLPLAAIAQGKPVPLFDPPTGWAVASNTVFGSNGLPMASNAAFDPATFAAANYIIIEEGSNDTFGSLTYTPGNPEQWTEATASTAWVAANIDYAQGNYSENLVENSSALSCFRSGVPAEYDVFLGPNNYDQGTNVTSAISETYRSNPSAVPSLSQLASLTVSGGIIISSVSQPFATTNCTYNHASMGFNIAFVDRLKNQNLSYSLHLASFCLPGPDYVSCTHQPQNLASWYKAGMVTAVNDTPTGLTSGLTIVPSGGSPINLPLAGPGKVTFTALNLLSRIETLIQNNPANLDKNISDWQISGLTYGSSIWGDSSLAASWQGLNIAATCKNASCS